MVSGVFKYGLEKEIRSFYNFGICLDKLPDIDSSEYDKYIHSYIYSKNGDYHYFLFRTKIRWDHFIKKLSDDGYEVYEHWLNPDYSRNSLDREKKKFYNNIKNYLDKPYTYAVY